MSEAETYTSVYFRYLLISETYQSMVYICSLTERLKVLLLEILSSMRNSSTSREIYVSSHSHTIEYIKRSKRAN
jgi:hypothetical protein